MWDLVGSLLALFLLVVTVVDVLIALVMVGVLRRWAHERRELRRLRVPDYPPDVPSVRPGSSERAPR